MLSRQWISSTDKPGGGGKTEEQLVNAWSEQGSWSSVLEKVLKLTKTKQKKIQEKKKSQCLGASNKFFFFFF